MILRELIENIYFPNVKKDNQKQNVFGWMATLNDIPLIKPLTIKFDQEMSQHFQMLKKRTESQLNLINIITRLQRVVFILSEYLKQPQNKEFRSKCQKNFLLYVKSCQENTISIDSTMYDFIDSFGQLNHKKRSAINSTQYQNFIDDQSQKIVTKLKFQNSIDEQQQNSVSEDEQLDQQQFKNKHQKNKIKTNRLSYSLKDIIDNDIEQYQEANQKENKK